MIEIIPKIHFLQIEKVEKECCGCSKRIDDFEQYFLLKMDKAKLSICKDCKKALANLGERYGLG